MSRFERFIFYTLIICIPFQIRWIFAQWTYQFNEWTAGFLYLSDILIIILLSLWVYRLIRSGQGLALSSSDYLIFALLFIAVLSIFSALNGAVALFRIVKLAEFAGFYFYIKSNLRYFKLNMFLSIVVASGFIQAVIAIAQSLKQGPVGLGFLGESPIYVGDKGVAVFEAGRSLFLRAYGLTPHPNILAAWLFVSMCAFFIWYFNYGAEQRYTAMAVYMPMLFGFFATFSRVIIVVWALGVFAVGIFLWRRRGVFRSTFKHLSVAIIGTLIVVIVFLIFYAPQIQARIHITLNDEAIQHRIFFIETAEDIGRAVPFLGVGPGQFVPVLMGQLKLYPSYVYQPVHNVYILVLSELGILGLAAFLLWIILILYGYIKKHRRHYTLENFTLLVVVFGVLFIGIFDHFLWTIQQGSFLLWGLLAIAAYKSK